MCQVKLFIVTQKHCTVDVMSYNGRLVVFLAQSVTMMELQPWIVYPICMTLYLLSTPCLQLSRRGVKNDTRSSAHKYTGSIFVTRNA